MVRRWLIVATLVLALPLAGSAQKGHVRDLETAFPQPEIFLQPVKYVAHTGAVTVVFRDSCVADGQPIPLCVELPPQPQTLTFEKNDVLSVVIPKKSMRNILAKVPRFGPALFLQNNSSSYDVGWFWVHLTTTMESPAFLDPRAVDPDTGEPLNGKLRLHLSGRGVTTSLGPWAPFTDYIIFTRHGYVGRSFLRDTMKLPEDLVDAFFDNDITVRVNIHGTAKLAINSSVYISILFEGN